MLRHAGDGVPAAQAAELASAARFKISLNPQPTARCGQAEADRAKMLGALERFDETTAEQVLDKLLATRGVMTIIQDIVLPLLRQLGERWVGAQVSVAQEISSAPSSTVCCSAWRAAGIVVWGNEPCSPVLKTNIARSASSRSGSLCTGSAGGLPT